MKKIFVSGSSGFVGSHVCKYLLKKGKEVVNNDRSVNGIGKLLDVTNLDSLLSVEDEVDAIVHLAAKTSIKNSFNSPHDVYCTNLLGTLNLLEFSRQRKIPRFIYISTYVYGQPKYLPIDEKHPIDPHSPYTKSKLLAEQLCRYYSDDFGVDVITLRPFYLYGPNPKPGSFIFCVLEQIKKDQGKVTLSGELTKRDFLFIDDFSILLERMLDKFPKGYNVYNVGYGKSYTLTQVTQIISRLLDKKVTINYDNKMRPGDVTDMVADITKVGSEFNWRPLISLEQGLDYTVKQDLLS